MAHPLYSVDFDSFLKKKEAKADSRTTSSQPTDPSSDDTSTWQEDAESLTDHADKALLLPSKPGEPGLADERILSRGLQVPSKSSFLTSGFEYPNVLANYHVSEEDWGRFTREVAEEARLSPKQWSTVIGAGLGTLVIGGMMLGVFSAVPAVFAARRKRQHHEERNLAAAVAVNSTSALSQKIEMWNESFFKSRGIIIRVDVPYDNDTETGRFEDMDVPSMSKREETTVKAKASKRPRIVIIPLEEQGRPRSLLSTASTLAEDTSSIAATTI